MTRTIDVIGSYVVGKADDLRFLGEPAFRFMAGDTPPELICSGSVVARGRSVDMFGVTTDDGATGAAGAQVILRESSSFRVHSVEQGATGFLLTMDEAHFSNAGSVRIGGYTFGIGLQMEGAGVVADNSGTFEVSSHTASGGITLGASSHLDNSGEIVVTAATEGAYGVIQYAGSHFHNSGVLDVSAELSVIAVQMSPGGVLDNDGQILATSRTGGALGMTFWDTASFHNTGEVIVRSPEPAFGINLGGSAEIINEGKIIVTTTGDGPSVGIWGISAPLDLDNSGLMRADQIVLFTGETVGAVIDNSGKLLGDLALSDGDDRVSNAGGVIRGDVLLAAGADHFDGGAGKLVGEVSGGDGDDVLVLGKTDDRIAGDAGADTLTGGAGSDIFVYGQVSDSSGAHADLITDLGARGDADTIDLSAIDADGASDGDQAFHLVGAFSGQAGELVVSYDAKHDVTLVLGDVDGDGKADLRIALDGDHGGFEGFVL